MGAKRVLDLSTDGIFLSSSRGFLIAQKEGNEILRVPMDQLDAVIIHAHGVCYTNNLLNKLLDQKCALVICGANHGPKGFIWGVEGHHRQAARIDLQIEKTTRLKGRLWKQIIQTKIQMQSENLIHFNKPQAASLAAMARKVKSGDPGNMEAQAARRYWSALLGNDFTRNQSSKGANALLNYGYTVLRALVARQIYASGLLPVMGFHHHNKNNVMRLVDDLMEPMRPIVDRLVVNLMGQDVQDICPQAKMKLGQLGHQSVIFEKGSTDLSFAIEYLLNSLVNIFEKSEGRLAFPKFEYELNG